MAQGLIASWARLGAELLFRPFAQIIFSRDLRVGALLLAAMCTFPRMAAAAVAAVFTTAALVRAIGLGTQAMREGLHACISVMIVLASSAFTPENVPLPLLAGLAAVLAVAFLGAWEALLGLFYLPAHAVPSVLGAWTVLLALRFLPLEPAQHVLSAPLAVLPAELLSRSFLDLPASMLYLRGTVAGSLVLAGLFLHSRIALVLAAVGMMVAGLMRGALEGAALVPTVETLAVFNAAYTAMALGGLWFIPSPSSLLFAILGAGLSAVLTYAIANFMAPFYLPVLGLPFAIATQLLLLTARRRERDSGPQSTLPHEKPEVALARHMMGTVRWAGAAPWVSFRLPFRGPWVVTQGNDGPFTHKAPWQHGFDFEVSVAGAIFDGSGAELRDYHCYGRPVLAAGAGTVALVLDGIPDNRPGQINTEQNWGNAVVISHGPAMYTVYAHLQPRSVRVKVGEYVALGAEIGRCGNSGRSAVPHLHFQAQKAAALGSPTLPVSFGDVVVMNEAVPQMATRLVPAEGEIVRPMVWDDGLAQTLRLWPGTTWWLEGDGEGDDAPGTPAEQVFVEIDLWGRTVLRSARATLYLMTTYAGLTAVDYAGDRDSRLRPLFFALARVPYDHASSLAWEDRLPLGKVVGQLLVPLADLAAMLFPMHARTRSRYHLTRDAHAVHVRGTSRRWSSLATLSFDGDRHAFELVQRGRRRRVILTSIAQAAQRAA